MKFIFSDKALVVFLESTYAGLEHVNLSTLGLRLCNCAMQHVMQHHGLGLEKERKRERTDEAESANYQRASLPINLKSSILDTHGVSKAKRTKRMQSMRNMRSC